MGHPSQHDRSVRRSGVVLLIVLAMLALFAVVALSFVFYADSAADSARFGRQAETLTLADVDPEKLLAYALGQLIFDTDNPNSKMYGHSLGRSIYGSPGGTIPYSGLGRPHPDTQQTLEGLTPFDGINVPYTYPDINNPFLACLDPSNPGFLKERSFYRNGSSLRPRSLPPVLGQEGDVRNIDSLDGTVSPTRPAIKLFNDSFWMDLDFPIMTAKDGTRFKPLFAFTVLDLDGRLNLGVSGNYQADYTKTSGTSRCGLGTWEINPARVLTIDKTEIARLFHGSDTAPSRLGDDNVPDNAVRFPVSRVYSRVDYTGASANAVARAKAPYSHLPTFGSWADIGWDTIANNEIRWGSSPTYGWPAPSIFRWKERPAQPHPVGFDYFGSRSPATSANDLMMVASNAEAIVRWRDRGAPALTSDLIRLLPANLTPQGTGGAQILNLITPYSMSLDTAHLAPFVAGDPNTRFQWNEGDPYPESIAVTQSVPQALSAGAAEFSPDFRSQIAAALPRINLNRLGGHVDTPDSQALAKEIFDRLVRVTGALPPAPGAPFQPANRADRHYKATRWLAQLAVNIVDFLDIDDNMTVFRWNPSPQPTVTDYVFGVEMNNLLINEAYASVDNDFQDVRGTNNGKKYHINAWAELFCPMAWEMNMPGWGGLSLVGLEGTEYRLLLTESTQGIADSPTGLPTNLVYAWNSPDQGVYDWGWPSSEFVWPGDGGANNRFMSENGFVVVGPPAENLIPARRPTWKDWRGNVLTKDIDYYASPGMQSGLKDMPADYNSLSKMKATLVLQRLARLYQKANDDPADPLQYNPFVTVDVFPDIPVNNSVQYFGTTDVMPPPLGKFKSLGRYQPMQASGVKLQSPTPAKSETGNEPQHTFSRHNTRAPTPPTSGDITNTLKMPFDTIYRMDRALISTAEALFAPMAPPWEMTQRFGTPQPIAIYSACQNDVNSLLFRFLETVTTGNRSYNRQLAPFNPRGVAGAGHHAILVPGKINLNTVSDERIIQALFDRQSNNVFTDDDVHQFWLDLLEVRKTRGIAGFSDYTFDRNTRAVTMQNTLLGNLFKKMSDRAIAAGANEFEASEGLRKVMNNITFTSNAFAAWVTAGFFEVDAAGNPIQEIGKDEGRHARRRMFAVVDRSQLVLPAPPQLTTLTGGAAKGTTTMTLAVTSGFLQSPDPKMKVDFPWQIKAGTVLILDRGQATEERVVVQNVSGNQIQIAGNGFLQQHNAGAPVDLGGIQGPQVPLNRASDGSTVPNFILGYPGPQAQFNLRDYWYVVPYFSIID